MIDNVKVRYVDWLSDNTSEMVTCCCEADGDYYTICLNEHMSQERLEKAYSHAISHIDNNDFYSRRNVQEIEKERHEL